MSMCWAHGWTVQKRLNRSTYCLAVDSCWSKEPCVKWGSRLDESIHSREAWQDGDAAFCQIAWTLVNLRGFNAVTLSPLQWVWNWLMPFVTWHPTDSFRALSHSLQYPSSAVVFYQFPARVLGLQFDVRGTFKWLFPAIFDMEMWSVGLCGCCCRKQKAISAMVSTCQYNSGWGPNVFDALLSLITVIPRYGNDINRTTINMDQAIWPMINIGAFPLCHYPMQYIRSPAFPRADACVLHACQNILLPVFVTL